MDAVRSAATGDRWFPSLEAAAQALQDLYLALNPAEHVETYLNRLCEHVVELVADADMAGVTVLDQEGSASTAALTSHAVAVIDELQYRSGAGPSLEAMESAEIVVADHNAAVERWPGFATEARTYGVASFLSIPLPQVESGVRIGAVNVYGCRPDGFARSEVALMNLFTTAAGYAISSTERYRGAHQLALELERALDSRAVIDQAKGVLAAVHGVDAAAAFEMLVEKSQRSNTKLRVVADGTPGECAQRRHLRNTVRLKILHIRQSTFPQALTDPHKVKPLAPKRCPAASQRSVPVLRLSAVAARSGISFGDTRGETEHRQPLQRTPIQSHSKVGGAETILLFDATGVRTDHDQSIRRYPALRSPGLCPQGISSRVRWCLGLVRLVYMCGRAAVRKTMPKAIPVIPVRIPTTPTLLSLGSCPGVSGRRPASAVPMAAAPRRMPRPNIQNVRIERAPSINAMSLYSPLVIGRS